MRGHQRCGHGRLVWVDVSILLQPAYDVKLTSTQFWSNVKLVFSVSDVKEAIGGVIIEALALSMRDMVSRSEWNQLVPNT